MRAGAASRDWRAIRLRSGDVATDTISAQIASQLSAFKLPTAAAQLVPRVLDGGHEPALPVLLEVFEHEQQDRHERRIERLKRASKLPVGKTFGTFDDKRLPRPLARKLRELATGAFLERAVNVLAFYRTRDGSLGRASGIQR